MSYCGDVADNVLFAIILCRRDPVFPTHPYTHMGIIAHSALTDGMTYLQPVLNSSTLLFGPPYIVPCEIHKFEFQPLLKN